MKKVLIAGASGCVGQAAVTEFEQAGWQVLSLSRRTPRILSQNQVKHVNVDLLDRDACERLLAGERGVTHVVYCASIESPVLTEGWRDLEFMQQNANMLENLLWVLQKNNAIEHISLLQGTKAYGAHLQPLPIPAKESFARHPHPNFYWLQEDLVRTLADKEKLSFTIFRPQVIFGDVAGVAMNLIPVIGAYAALCKKRGEPFSYPGGHEYPLEAVDARLLAKALHWATGAESAKNEIFNITNGDVFGWHSIWPRLAAMLDVEIGPDTPRSLAQWLSEQEKSWAEIAKSRQLLSTDLSQLVGYSAQYADFCFGYGLKKPPKPALVSTIKIRQAGFDYCVDTEQMFAYMFQSMRQLRLLP